MISFSHSHSSTKGIYGQSINKTTTTKKIIHDDLCWHFRFIWIIFEAKKKEKKKNTHKEHQYIQTQQFFYIKKSKWYLLLFLLWNDDDDDLDFVAVVVVVVVGNDDIYTNPSMRFIFFTLIIASFFFCFVLVNGKNVLGGKKGVDFFPLLCLMFLFPSILKEFFLYLQQYHLDKLPAHHHVHVYIEYNVFIILVIQNVFIVLIIYLK